ncbi:hypothetical protein [Fusibacter sp. JL216-2]|uniref:hypothetical protein n=1 Tax=Fusibacter sp. JL216-2 TaxID=3071453 RepID=UPI003D3509AF
MENPEDGWDRYDYIRSNLFDITGTYIWYEDDSNAFNSTRLLSRDEDKRTVFWFYGSKIRLICGLASNRSQNTTIKIDGNEEQFSTYASTGSVNYQMMAYEKLDLTMGLHKVEIYDTSKLYLDIDAIDIDENGVILEINDTLRALDNNLEKNYLLQSCLKEIETLKNKYEELDEAIKSFSSTSDSNTFWVQFTYDENGNLISLSSQE